ncbi:MAG: 3-phosphoglycerate dehydrogenase [Pedobacter sp.]|nr:MAG: 3-phosphoglycerate dehydrogenase [Pedobacter sp.]
MRILANDGIDPIGKKLLEEAGFIVDTETVAMCDLAAALQNYDAITVRSATQVRKDLVDKCPGLKLIGRGGVGMDNIDVAYAVDKGLAVVNTPAASSLSVAELVFAHLFTCVRFLHDSNRQMPLKGNTAFNELKKAYAKGTELRGKSIGIIGFGRIGREVATIALGLGMDVFAYDLNASTVNIQLNFTGNRSIDIPVTTVSLEELIRKSDFISIHTPFSEKPILGASEFDQMKKGVGIVNCSRGGTIDEQELINALDSGKVAFAGLDVFENEPEPAEAILKHPKISLTPHIGASTNEAQERIGSELASLIITHFKG